MIDELDLLRRLFDADLSPADDGVRTAIKARVDDFLADEVSQVTIAERPRSRRRRRRRTAGTALVATGIAAAISVGVMFAGSGTTLHVSPAAAAVLRRAASAAATAPGVPAGDYLYTRAEITELELVQASDTAPVGGYDLSVTQETWVNGAGAGRVETTQKSISVLPGTQGGAPALQPPQNVSIDATKGEGFPYIVNPSGWPTEPEALKAAIVERLEAGRANDYATFLDTTYLLYEVNDPALRSACFHVLATLPGLTDYGTATDLLGRAGRAVGMTVDGIRTDLLVDPETGALLQIKNTIVSPKSSAVPSYSHLPAGTVLNNALIVNHAEVPSDQVRP